MAWCHSAFYSAKQQNCILILMMVQYRLCIGLEITSIDSAFLPSFLFFFLSFFLSFFHFVHLALHSSLSQLCITLVCLKGGGYSCILFKTPCCGYVIQIKVDFRPHPPLCCLNFEEHIVVVVIIVLLTFTSRWWF